MRLPGELVDRGDRLLAFPALDSTMDEARRQFDAGLAARLWIVTGGQDKGRGRQGRVWHSPPGNLHMTLLLPAPCPMRDQPKLGFAAGVALARAAQSLLPATARVGLKWPNDLLVDGAKVSGLLLEGLGQGTAVAIGIGVNVVAHPPDTPYPANHLQSFAADVSRDSVFDALARALTEELAIFADGTGFPLTRQRWLAFAAHRGAAIRVRQGETFAEGLFRDIDGEGRLILENGGQLTRIEAGDVFPLDK